MRSITHYFRDKGWWYYVCHPWRYLKDLYWDAHGFIQRGRRGYAGYDTWEFCDYLAAIICPVLKRFRERGHGYPSEITAEEWDAILTEMIAGFEASLAMQYLEDDSRSKEELMATQERGLALFAKWFGALWD